MAHKAHEILILEEVDTTTKKDDGEGEIQSPLEVDPAVFNKFTMDHVPLYVLKSDPVGKARLTEEVNARKIDCEAKLVPLSIPTHARRILSIDKDNKRTYYSEERDILQFSSKGVMSGLIMLLYESEVLGPADPATNYSEPSCRNDDSCLAKQRQSSKESLRSAKKQFLTLLETVLFRNGENNACVDVIKSESFSTAGKEHEFVGDLQSLFLIEWNWNSCLEPNLLKKGLHKKLSNWYFGEQNSPITMLAVAAPDRSVMWVPLFQKDAQLSEQLHSIITDGCLTAYWPTYLDGPNIWICKLENLPWLPFGRRHTNSFWHWFRRKLKIE